MLAGFGGRIFPQEFNMSEMFLWSGINPVSLTLEHLTILELPANKPVPDISHNIVDCDCHIVTHYNVTRTFIN